MLKAKRWLAVLMALATLAPAPAASLAAGQQSRTEALRLRDSAVVGQAAPDFALRDLQGKQCDLQSLRGRVVLLDFWASWCPPCRLEMPILEKLHREFKDQGVVVIAINLEGPEEAGDFLQENGYTFTTLLDESSQVAQRYGVAAIPTMLMIDGAGQIIARHVGLQSEAALRADLLSCRVGH